MTMKKGLISTTLVIFLALAVLQAVPTSANLPNPNKSITGAIEDRIINANITPTTVKPGGTITATGIVQWNCSSSSCNPPGWRPNGYMEVHLDHIANNGTWYVWANGTTDSNGYFSLQTQAPTIPGSYMFAILVPVQGIDAGYVAGPWLITVG